jgi:hypothetical protein
MTWNTHSTTITNNAVGRIRLWKHKSGRVRVSHSLDLGAMPFHACYVDICDQWLIISSHRKLSAAKAACERWVGGAR